MGRPKYLGWMHGIGVALSIVALVVGGLYNPAIGFPVAVAVLIALEIPSSSDPPNKEILRVIYGSIIKGGIRRGIFIKGLFTLAVIYLAASSFVFGMRTAGFSNAILGVALVISCVASEIEARAITEAINRIS